MKDNQYTQFFDTPTIAVIGASRNPGKYGNMIYVGLKKLGYDVVPVNPFADFIDGDISHKDLSQLDPKSTALVLVTHRNDTDKTMQEAIEMGFSQFWVQTSCDTPSTPIFAENRELNVIYQACILIIMKRKEKMKLGL
ncbi:MAG: CoA-binding protein [Bacteroidales bacterium]|jgi:predicted CoA-binding protein|nr:CoA-binding protein [Bacteroidales bacterium]